MRASQDHMTLHRIPVIDKMMQVLDLLQRAGPHGLSIGQIVVDSDIPRSTVYRLLNTLQAHAVLARTPGGGYTLGFRLRSLASGVKTSFTEAELIALVTPHLVQLANNVGETCKFSILRDHRAEVVAVEQSARALAPSSRIGSSFDLHAGAASKLLLAFAAREVLDRSLAAPLPSHTAKTIVDPKALLSELASIRETGISFDRGEWNESVHAIAAPVFFHEGEVAGALSVTYFATKDDDAASDRITPPLREACATISEALGYSR